MNPSTNEIVATSLFVLAVIQTFLAKKIEHQAHKYPEGSIMANLFHFLGEVEVVFGFWAGLFVIYLSATQGLLHGAVHFLEGLNFTEPAFVFVIMCMAGTRPVIIMAERLIVIVAKVLPFPQKMAFYVSSLVMGPLLGSFITEPAAMTVTALILLNNFYQYEMSDKFKYATIGLLFVNVSIGGTLSHFAAPPVLMVAGKWGWNLSFMFGHFGYKAAIAVAINTIVVALLYKKELQGTITKEEENDGKLAPTWWIYLLHIFFLALVVMTAHHMVFFLGLFLFFLGFTKVTEEYQSKLALKESLLVGFFLGGLVTLGALQKWWLQPVLSSMSDFALYIGATGLTAITDNAALTYLGSLVDLTDSAKYNLVAGAVTGGGLTVIANAPNPAGFGILKSSFGENGIGPGGLFKAALFPTLVALAMFQVLPNWGDTAHPPAKGMEEHGGGHHSQVIEKEVPSAKKIAKTFLIHTAS